MSRATKDSDWDLIPEQLGSFDRRVLVAVCELRRKEKEDWWRKGIEFLAGPEASSIAHRVMGPEYRHGSRHWQHVVAALGRLRKKGLVESYYATDSIKPHTQRYRVTEAGRKLAVEQYGAQPRDGVEP